MDTQIIIALAALAFFATNLDNLGILILLIAEKAWTPGQVVRGYLVSLVLIIGFCWLLAQAMKFGLDAYTGYVGLIPIAVGVFKLVTAYRPIQESDVVRRSRKGAGNVISMMLAMSWDSLAIYFALFVDTRANLVPVVLVTLPVCGVLWISAARWLASTRMVSEPLEQWGRYMLPFMLIALGGFILLDTPTDVI